MADTRAVLLWTSLFSPASLLLFLLLLSTYYVSPRPLPNSRLQRHFFLRRRPLSVHISTSFIAASNHRDFRVLDLRRRLASPSVRRLRKSVCSETPCMKIRVAIVGLPNAGKSALFNTLARQEVARSANYPFCTIDPNVAPVPIPDGGLLERLGSFAGSERTVPAYLEWVDVAGLVRGASKGEGLGNRFLANVRECALICHVLRCHEDPDVIHVDGRVGPVNDADIVNLELLLADLAHVERRLEKTTCTGMERETLETIAVGLNQGIPARKLGISDSAAASVRSMGLLTLKPVIYALNLDEADFALGREEALTMAEKILSSIAHGDPELDTSVLVSARMESEITSMNVQEQVNHLKSLGMEEAEQSFLSCHALPLRVVQVMGLGMAYTGPGVPPERSRTTKAHLFSAKRKGGPMTAANLAGRIHGTIEKGFIRAEVAPAAKLLEYSGFTAAKEAGIVRSEGRDYILKDDDVILVRWK